jgi:hypothetical protein
LRGRLLCALLCGLLCATRAQAGDPPKAPDPQIPLTPQPTTTDRYYQSFGNGIATFGRNVYQDLGTQLRWPFGFARQHPFGFSIGALGLGALIATDHKTHPAMTDWVGDTGRAKAQKLSDFGRAPTGLYAMAGFGVLGLVTGSEREQTTSVLLLESMLTTSVWTNSLKALAGRERPREVDATFAEWEGPHFMGDQDEVSKSLRSFPSGHTAGAFALATVLAHQYPSKGIVPVLAYGGAATMGFSRMVVDAHWLSDVVVGGLIGYGSARAVIHNHEARGASAPEKSGMQWGLDLSPGYQGVNLHYDF